MIVRLGGYMVESNMGHIGDVLDPKAGDDPTIYGFRAAAEVGPLLQVRRRPGLRRSRRTTPTCWGGSGGARRSPLCLQYAPDVWDAALPFMGDAMVGEHGDFTRLRARAAATSPPCSTSSGCSATRSTDVVDAMSPGGSGNPFAGLDTHQREELANLYRLGYPRGDEWVIGQPSGTIWLWCSMADRLTTRTPTTSSLLDQARLRRPRLSPALVEGT